MADEIRVTPLGAGQDVGRSCILVSMGGKNIMLDCGMHMGFQDERRFPDFSFVAPKGEPLTPHIDCVIISHFHLDHCGALPFMSEMAGYDGPIYMTHPTKAICPLLLEDMRKIAADVKKEQGFFTQQMIKDCMKKVINAPGSLAQVSEAIHGLIKSRVEDDSLQFLSDGSISVDSVLLKVTAIDPETEGRDLPSTVQDKSAAKKVIVSWTYQDEDLGSFLLTFLKTQYL